MRGHIRALEIVGKDAEAYRDLWRHPPVSLAARQSFRLWQNSRHAGSPRLTTACEARAAKLSALNEREKLLTQRLAEAGGTGFAKEAVLTLEKNASGPVDVRCVYSSANAGWRPLYRLEARPDDGVVELRLDAEIWQRSGRNWKNAELQLATADPRRNMTPPALAAWIARPRPTQPAALARSAGNSMLMDSAPIAAEMGASVIPCQKFCPPLHGWSKL